MAEKGSIKDFFWLSFVVLGQLNTSWKERVPLDSNITKNGTLLLERYWQYFFPSSRQTGPKKEEKLD